MARKQGKDLKKMAMVVERLAEGKSLEAKHKDHDLMGDYKGCRECHIERIGYWCTRFLRDLLY